MKKIAIDDKDDFLLLHWGQGFSDVSLTYNGNAIAHFHSLNELAGEKRFLLPDGREVRLKMDPLTLVIHCKVDGVITEGPHPGDQLKIFYVLIAGTLLFLLGTGFLAPTQHLKFLSTIHSPIAYFSACCMLACFVAARKGIPHIPLVIVMILAANWALSVWIFRVNRSEPGMDHLVYLVLMSLVWLQRKKYKAYTDYVSEIEAGKMIIDR